MRTISGANWDCGWGQDDPQEAEPRSSAAVMRRMVVLQQVARLVAGLRLAAGQPGSDG
jgi:hypothetical protein